MPWWMLIALHGPRLLRDPEPNGDGGGGGGKPPAPNPNPAPDPGKAFSELQSKYDALIARFEKLEGGGKPPAPNPNDPPHDPDLRERARLQAEADKKKGADNKAFENAIRFSLNAPNWLKENQSLLPKGVNDIFAAAEKENFTDAIEKDSAIKAGIIGEFFSVQANMDLLTSGLKSQLEEYLKLTKNGKQDRAQSVYESIFEPAFDTLKRVKKAEALNKGYGTGSSGDDAYKQKMTKLSRAHYLGEKANGT